VDEREQARHSALTVILGVVVASGEWQTRVASEDRHRPLEVEADLLTRRVGVAPPDVPYRAAATTAMVAVLEELCAGPRQRYAPPAAHDHARPDTSP
jgi:hypothetical protein